MKKYRLFAYFADTPDDEEYHGALVATEVVPTGQEPNQPTATSAQVVGEYLTKRAVEAADETYHDTGEAPPDRMVQEIRYFLDAFWQSRCWQLEQSVIGTRIEPRYPQHNDLLYQSALADQLYELAKAADGEFPDDEENKGVIYESCQQLAEWLFAAPTMAHYHIPDYWAETPVGAIWWRALMWCQGDELITVKEAAVLAGISQASIGQRITRGTLKAYIDPAAPARQGRRLVRHSDALAIKAENEEKAAGKTA